MLDIMFGVAFGMILSSVLLTVVVFTLMSDARVIKWYLKKVNDVADAIIKATEEQEDELDLD